MKAITSFLLCFLISACICNHNQELVNSVNNMQQAAPDVSVMANSCESQRYFWTHQTDRQNVNAIGDQAQAIRLLKGDHGRQFFMALKDLKYGTRAMSLSFENHISDTVSGVIAKALIGYRYGDSIVASVGVATSSCDMIQQFNVVSYQKCKKILFIKKCHNVQESHPRGFHPHELNSVLAKLQSDASKELYTCVCQNTGLSADEHDQSLQSLYIQESQVLRRYYPEITYDYTELSEVPQHEMITAVLEASAGQIGDYNILNRMVQIAISAANSSFFYSPHNNLLYVISINRTGDSFLIRMSSFTVAGRLPGGAFATSVGGWNLEVGGNPVNPSVHELLAIFPPLK